MPSKLSNICMHREYFGEGFHIVLEENMALNFVDLCSGSTSTMKPSYVPKSISSLLKDLENIGNIDNKLELLNFHLHQYEVELSGVEGVKDLFPRCMLLLLDAVETLRNEIAEVKATNTSSIQREIGCLESKRKSHKEDQTRDLRVGGKDLVNPNHDKRQRRNSSKTESDKGTEMLGRSHNVMADYHPMPLTEPARKNNRRSWTTELCNNFITAVETLGGPKVATPSEIKRLMQVEGLTTDQVKSHLQKYRHHSRRASQPNENPENHPIDFQEQWICESFPASIMIPNSSDVHFGASHNMPGHENKNAESSTPDSK